MGMGLLGVMAVDLTENPLVEVGHFQDLVTKSTPVVDVRAFGASGDGETDDTDAIQAAIDAAGDRGATIYLPAGTYLISETLTIENDYVRICGDGDGHTTIQQSDVAENVITVGVTGAEGRRHHIVIEGLRTLDGDYGIWMNAYQSRLVGVRTEGAATDGQYWESPWGSSAIDCMWHTAGSVGLRLAGNANGTVILNGYWYDCDIGLASSSCAGLSILGGDCEQNDTGGMDLYGTMRGVRVSGVDFEGNDSWHIRLGNSAAISGVAIEGNNFSADATEVAVQWINAAGVRFEGNHYRDFATVHDMSSAASVTYSTIEIEQYEDCTSPLLGGTTNGWKRLAALGNRIRIPGVTLSAYGTPLPSGNLLTTHPLGWTHTLAGGSTVTAGADGAIVVTRGTSTATVTTTLDLTGDLIHLRDKLVTFGCIVSANADSKACTVSVAGVDGAYNANIAARMLTTTGFVASDADSLVVSFAGGTNSAVYTVSGFWLAVGTEPSEQYRMNPARDFLGGVTIRNADTSAGYLDFYEDSDVDATAYVRESIAIVDLSNAQIKDLADTPVELVAAPGAGKWLELCGASLWLDYGTNALTEADSPDDLAIEYDSGTGPAASASIVASGFITATADTGAFAIPVSLAGTAATSIVNKNLALVNTGADYTGNAGNDTIMRVIVRYRVHSGLGL
jgi:hypothetical protein